MAQKNKFQFQSFKGAKPDNTSAQAQFQLLCDAIDEIYMQNCSQLSFEALYGTAYKLILQKQGDQLYDRVKNSLTGHLNRSVETITRSAPDCFLNVIVQEWSIHKTAFRMTKDVLMYVDRSYCVQKKRADIFTMAMHLFREVIIYHPFIRNRLRSSLLEQITLERMGNMIDRSLLREALIMLMDVNVTDQRVYEEEFELHFLTETENFYRNESLNFLSIFSCMEYISKIETRFTEENARIIHYLSLETEGKLTEILENELLTKHCKTLISHETSGFLCMLYETNFQGKLTDIRRFFHLFARVPSCFELIREAFGVFIVTTGKNILNTSQTVVSTTTAVVGVSNLKPSGFAEVSEEKLPSAGITQSQQVVQTTKAPEPSEFVHNIFTLKQKCDAIILTSCKNDKRLTRKCKESFETFINADTRTAAYLSAFLDEFLRDCSSHTETDIDSTLESILTIFRYLQDKDLFENYYKSSLCKRLLANKSTSDEVEKTVIAKLKAECGYQYTSKLEGMFLDMGLSKGVMEEFKKSVYYTTLPSTVSAGQIELEVQVLTTGYWPLSTNSPCILPQTLKTCVDIFSSFYHDKYSGRKLAWATNISFVDLKAIFPVGGRKDLNVTTYQACILLLFAIPGRGDTFTLDQIRQATGISDMDLKRHLLSLCTPKLKILVKASKGKGIEENDSFTFNSEFTSKFKRIKVPLISAKEITAISSASSSGTAGDHSGSNGGGQGSKESEEEMAMLGGPNFIPPQVEEDRRHLVEAVIVRTMKARRTLSHNDLVAEVTRQLSYRFNPNPTFIKKRIESLIERDFLSRNGDDARLYNYLA